MRAVQAEKEEKMTEVTPTCEPIPICVVPVNIIPVFGQFVGIGIRLPEGEVLPKLEQIWPPIADEPIILNK